MPEGKRPHPRFSLARHCLENAVDNCPVRHHVIVVILPRAGSRGAQEQVVFLHRSMSRIIVTSPCPNLLPPLARSGSSSSANPATAPKEKMPGRGWRREACSKGSENRKSHAIHFQQIAAERSLIVCEQHLLIKVQRPLGNAKGPIRPIRGE